MLELTNVSFRDDQHLLRIIDKIVSQVGRRVDESTPMVDARLSDGSRVNAIIPPLAVDGPLLSIRRFGTDKLMPPDLVERKALTPGMMELLEAAVKARLNIIIAGGTGAGKTTLLNALSVLHLAQRAHRHHRRRGRIAVEAAARGAPGNPARRTSKATAPCGSASCWSTACVCVPTASSSAKSAARKRWTCCRP